MPTCWRCREVRLRRVFIRNGLEKACSTSFTLRTWFTVSTGPESAAKDLKVDWP